MCYEDECDRVGSSESRIVGGREVEDRRRIGFWISTSLVVGNMVGSGVFLLPASLAAYGGISLVGWLLTSTGALLLALTFARLGRLLPHTGGPYIYAREGFGDFAGFLVGWGHWIATFVGNAAIAVGFVGYLGFLWPAVTAGPVPAVLTALAAIWLLTGINALGVREGGIVQLVTTVLKLLPLLGIAFFGLFHLDPSNFRPFNLAGGSPFGAVTATATLTLWAFIGLESATVPADEVRDPERTIPRATLIGTMTTAVIYILGTVAVMGLIPPDQLAESTAPFADAASHLWGGGAAYLVAIGAAISSFGALNGWILLQGQIPLAIARDGLFPKHFARLSRRGTPVFGLILSSLLVTGLMVMNYTRGLVEQFTFIILLSTLTALIPYLFAPMAELVIRGRSRDLGRGEAVLAVLAFLYALWAVAGSGAETVYWGFILMMAGIPVYVWVTRDVSTSGSQVTRPGPTTDS